MATDVSREYVSGFNIYYWGLPEQNHLIHQCLFPLISRMCHRSMIKSLWYDRNNLRGPHLFVLVTTHPSHCSFIRTEMCLALSRYIAQRPSTCQLSLKDLEALHDDGGGKAMCDYDLESGFAANNSFADFCEANTGNKYPFSLFREFAPDVFFPAEKRLCLLTMEYLHNDEQARADMYGLQFLIACNEILFHDQQQASRYWAYHASTIVTNLDFTKLRRSTVTQLLSKSVCQESLLRVRAWRQQITDHLAGRTSHETAQTSIPIFKAISVIEQLRAAIDRFDDQVFTILREIIHLFLKQLGIPTLRQIPMIFLLIAWTWLHKD